MEEKLQKYIQAKEEYEKKLEEVNKYIYKLEVEMNQAQEELMNQFGTTDSSEIEKKLNEDLSKIEELEKQLASLGNEQ